MNESEAEKRLRFLCSCDAERLSDYERINRFITASHELLAEMSALRDQTKFLTDQLRWERGRK